MPRPRRRCDSVHPLQFFRGRSSSAERSFDMREAKRAALFVPTIFEGIAQPARADASHASGQRCKSFYPHRFLSLWCSPANMPASHAGDHRSEAGQGRQFLGAWFTGNCRPTWLRTRQPWTCKSSRADQFQTPSKHCQRCACSVSRPAWCNSGWGLHFHNPNAVEPALKQVS